MINAILFVLLKCFLYWKGVRILTHITLGFISMYEKNKYVFEAVLAIVFFVNMIVLFFFGIGDIITDVIAMGGLL